MVQALESHVFLETDSGELILETKLNNTQYLIEYMNDKEEMVSFATIISLHDYLDLYEFQGVI